VSVAEDSGFFKKEMSAGKVKIKVILYVSLHTQRVTVACMLGKNFTLDLSLLWSK
jgi:hypothetical protein